MDGGFPVNRNFFILLTHWTRSYAVFCSCPWSQTKLRKHIFNDVAVCRKERNAVLTDREIISFSSPLLSTRKQRICRVVSPSHIFFLEFIVENALENVLNGKCRVFFFSRSNVIAVHGTVNVRNTLFYTVSQFSRECMNNAGSTCRTIADLGQRTESINMFGRRTCRIYKHDMVVSTKCRRTIPSSAQWLAYIIEVVWDNEIRYENTQRRRIPYVLRPWRRTIVWW